MEFDRDSLAALLPRVSGLEGGELLGTYHAALLFRHSGEFHELEDGEPETAKVFLEVFESLRAELYTRKWGEKHS